MWHVDEGTLNAYLDGALDEYPASEARRVREHLDACASCRGRLEAERRVRDEAASILGLAAPRVDVPTLEEMRAHVRAGGSRPRSTHVRLYRLGWAASVALALGTGWLLRGGSDDPGVAAVVPEMGVPEGVEAGRPQTVVGAPTAPTAQESAPIETAAAETAAPAVGLGDAASAVQDVLVTDAADAPSAATADVVDVELREPPENVAARLTPDPEPEPLVVAAADQPDIEPDIERDAPAEPAEPRDDVRPRRRQVPPPVVTSARVTAPTVGLAVGRTPPAPESRDAVPEEDDSYPLVVPGLHVLDVRNRGSGTRPEGQVALQLLESGDTLQVIHLPLELDPSSVLEPSAPGTNELTMRRSAGWIVMRAPTDEATLMALMTRLLAGD